MNQCKRSACYCKAFKWVDEKISVRVRPAILGQLSRLDESVQEVGLPF